MKKLTRSDQASTPAESLAGKNTLEQVPLLAVSTEQEADLAATNTNVTSGDVSVGPDVPTQLPHEGDAESPNLCVTLVLRVKVGPTLATAHILAGESIFEDLLKTKELETAGQEKIKLTTRGSLFSPFSPHFRSPPSQDFG